MFYVSEDGVQIIQFGTGDIEVANGVLDNPDETIGCLSLIPQAESPIGSIGARGDASCDNCLDIGVHTRLVFTKIESIDVVIKHLQGVKETMLKDMET